MNLYVIRHADALPLGADGNTEDETRPLSSRGYAQCQDLAAALQHHGVRPGIFLTSPLVRARQTADEILRHWNAPAPETQICEELSPGGKRRLLAEAIRDQEFDAVALVGHQPDLGEFVAWLIGSKKARVEVDKAGLACVHFEGKLKKASGSLVCLITNEWVSTTATC